MFKLLVMLCKPERIYFRDFVMFYNFFFKYSPLLWVLKKKKIRNLILVAKLEAKFGVFIVLIVLTESYKIWFRFVEL